MTRLTAADLEGVLSFLEDAQTVDGPAPFTADLLDRLAEIVGGMFATYVEVDGPRRAVHGYVLCSAETDSTWCDSDKDWWTSPRTVQLDRYKQAHGPRPMIVLSDVFTHRQRTSGEFNLNFRDHRVSDEILINLDPGRPWFALLNVAHERDFGDRERLMLDLLRPHLRGLYRSAELRQRLAAATSTFDPDALDRLTPREHEVMRCVAEGLSNAETASVLVIERGTVRKHLEHIYEKLDVRSRTAALAKLRA
jgi:DNA-binding CsgD family transcriptional regulator